MKGRGGARTRNQTLSSCSAPMVMQKCSLAREGHIQTCSTLLFLLFFHEPSRSTQDTNLCPQPSWATKEPHCWQPWGISPSYHIYSVALSHPFLRCVFSLSCSFASQEPNNGVGKTNLSPNQVIFHLVSCRCEVFAAAACVCLYLSLHVLFTLFFLVISELICHSQLHLAERLRSKKIIFLEDFWRRNFTLTLLRRQEAAEMCLQLRVCKTHMICLAQHARGKQMRCKQMRRMQDIREV